MSGGSGGGGTGGRSGGGGGGATESGNWRDMPKDVLSDAQISKLTNDQAYDKAVEFYKKMSGEQSSATMTEEQSKYFRKLKKQANAITDTQRRQDMSRAGYGEGNRYY